MNVEPSQENHAPERNGDAAVFAAVRDSAETATGVLHLARAFAAAGRRLDLHGLDAQMGQLCARVLDLSYDDSRALRAHLERILTEVDLLAATICAVASGHDETQSP